MHQNTRRCIAIKSWQSKMLKGLFGRLDPTTPRHNSTLHFSTSAWFPICPHDVHVIQCFICAFDMGVAQRCPPLTAAMAALLFTADPKEGN